MRSSKVAQYGLFAALAILMGYVEMLIPLPLLVPGMKLGLANVIIVIVLYHMDTKSAFFISLVRVLIPGLCGTAVLSGRCPPFSGGHGPFEENRKSQHHRCQCHGWCVP